MPLPKARKGASKKEKRAVMSQCMRELSAAHPEWPRKRRIAACMRSSGQSRKKK